MKKTLLTLVLPIVAILVGIGLVVGSFHPQTRTIPSHNPVAAQSVSSALSSSPPGTSSSTGGKQKQRNQTAGKAKTSNSQASSAASSGNKSSHNSVPKKTGSSTSGTVISDTGTAASTSSTAQAKASGEKASTGGASDSHAASASSSQSGASSGASSKQSSVSVSIQGLNGFNTSGSAAYRSGDSAFSELQQFTQAKGIQLSYSGFGSSIYISSINYQKAGQTSPSSGWMYTVNGKQPNISAGAYRTKSDDKIVWYYTK
jgi:hypothetical protein